MQEILLRELNGIGRRLHHPGQRVEAGARALHRAHRPGQPARRRRRRRARRAARRRDPALGRRLPPGARAQARRRARPRCCSTRYADALPETYKDEHTPVRGGQGPRQAGAARGARPAGDAPVPQEPRRRRRAVQGLPLRRADDALRRAAGAALARRAGHRRAAVRDRAAPTAPSTSTTSACSCRPARASLPRCARTWRTRSRPPGAARPRSTASTSSCCGPG